MAITWGRDSGVFEKVYSSGGTTRGRTILSIGSTSLEVDVMNAC